jgi:hypothetical protein
VKVQVVGGIVRRFSWFALSALLTVAAIVCLVLSASADAIGPN